MKALASSLIALRIATLTAFASVAPVSMAQTFLPYQPMPILRPMPLQFGIPQPMPMQVPQYIPTPRIPMPDAYRVGPQAQLYGRAAGAFGVNHEGQVMAECAGQFGVNQAGAACVAGRLTVDELNKCFTDGMGGRGCFGDNNTLVSIVRNNWQAARRESGTVNQVIRGATGVSIRDIRERGPLGGDNSEARKLCNGVAGIFGGKC